MIVVERQHCRNRDKPVFIPVGYMVNNHITVIISICNELMECCLKNIKSVVYVIGHIVSHNSYSLESTPEVGFFISLK